MAKHVVFLDRDGTINVDAGYVHMLESFVFLPASLQALKKLSAQKIDIYIVTNQSGIAKGLYTEGDYHRLTASMLKMLAHESVSIVDVLYCPHHPEGTVPQYTLKCDCRKPAHGLLKKVFLQNKYQKKDAVMIGDKNSDIEAGKSFGLRTYLVETGYGDQEKPSTKADYVVVDLNAAVDHLLSSWGKTS